MAETKLTGFDEVIKKMRALPVALRKKSGRSALGKAAKVIREQAKANVMASDDPDTGRKIAANIVQRFRSKHFKRTGDLMISVGVATDRGAIPEGNPDGGPKGNTPHWHLVELGTEKTAARPFLRPAAEAAAGQAIATFGTELDKAIDKLVQKGGGK